MQERLIAELCPYQIKLGRSLRFARCRWTCDLLVYYCNERFLLLFCLHGTAFIGRISWSTSAWRESKFADSELGKAKISEVLELQCLS